MAPRKKPASSSSSTRKANLSRQQLPTSKYGIQHFFERHSQTQAASSSSCTLDVSKPVLNPNSKPAPNPSSNVDLSPTSSKPSPADLPQPAAMADSEEKLSPVSPEFTKNVPFKRFKFSPRLLIKQSQDDGGDDITWKISPLNERLRPLNAKQLPTITSMLSDQPRPIASFIHPCMQKQNSSCSPAARLEKWLSSPTVKDTGGSLSSSRKLSLEQEIEMCHGNESACMETSSKVFQTPPSALYDGSKCTVGMFSNGESDELGFGKHHKAFIELLDQVEDVIIDKAVPNRRMQRENFCDPSGQKKETCNLKENKAAVAASQKVDSYLNDEVFLVLEVSEKHGTADSSHVHNPYKVLRLLHELTGEERALYLCDEWFYSIIGPGDTVNVVGKFDEGKCIVDHSNNLVIVFPNILMSGTRVASSFSCPRRAVLDERLRASEYSSPALIGTMLHQIFQAGLLEDSPTRHFLDERAAIILQENIENLYACGANQSATFAELLQAIPRIINWIKCFRGLEEREKAVVDFGHNEGQKEVSIIEVMDIEEMAWAPKYGLKGIIDASLHVKRGVGVGDSMETIIPLEFKSGKGTTGQIAVEHRAQVILYTLLMSERYLRKDVDSGLLYYLHTDETRGIKVQRSDLVGLIMRRNELASDILKASTSQVLPPMLKNPTVCQNCRHLNSCSIYHKAYAGSYETSGLGDLYDKKTGHLNIAHLEFLKHWDRLIDLEAKTCQVASKEIFRGRHLRENNSSCLSSLVLDVAHGVSVHGSLQNGRYVYHFVRQRASQHDHEMVNVDMKQISGAEDDSLVCSLRCGDFVVISLVNGRPAIAHGIICSINQFRVSISLSRRLRIPGSHQSSETNLNLAVWRIDKDEISTSYAMMRFNLLELFVPNLQISRLRKMVVDLEAPRFDSGGLLSQDPSVSYVHLENCINDDQRRAIKKILSAKDYTLILGMPGTGKTSTMVHAVKALLIRGASILLTSYTNSAVDNLLIKLKAQGIDFIRLGRQEAVHEDIRQHCFTDMHSVDDVKQRMDQIRVVGVTCLGIKHPLLVNKTFDVCIMDEAGQIALPVSLGPLMLASTFVLVGDHYQLPPLVQSTEARENGMAVSLFCRLSEAHPQAISALQSQYRMCAGIMELSNALIYGNRLRCGSQEVANAKIKLTTVEPIKWWLKEVLDPNKSVVFINTDKLPAPEVREKNNVHNPAETRIISEITWGLLEREVSEDEVGIITPYNSQASLIRRAISASVEIHTIDKYQGRDKDCLIVSFVRSSESSKSCSSSLLGDWHRINVALTRAKKKLIMVGSCGTLSNVPLLKLLIDKVNEQGGLLHISNSDLGQFKELEKCPNVTV
ncbi:DNA replication ATP-dependent helicase/nuclease DNA2 isoform X1 [Dendrobium catenatum]|uniref:DNA replication ATP-dependent helicase/nuclease DNA2 isoform X1 n=1 Tax=Dendrobium catenatum TaxID=906689 RepID=UPI0009F30573|nr:DNA replication ATP-dependent helicase/nuclease DNA2 isoform X1 [Dendrobium catenatum]